MRIRQALRRATILPVALATCLQIMPAGAQEADLIDRVVAVVNREVITLAQLRRAVRTAREADDDRTAVCTPPAGENPSFEERVLQCMIDDTLKFQHVRRFPQFDVLQESIDSAFERYAGQYATAEAFEAELRRQQRTVDEVRYDLEREALIANYIDARYRAIVDISEREIRQYYDEVLRPEMERQGAEMPALDDVDELIERTLVETEVNRRVDEWVADLRRRADIVVYTW
jgi:peptidyl-prolyl cis-trans isomerase SurA